MSFPEQPAGQFDDQDSQPHETRYGRDRDGHFSADVLTHQLREIGAAYADAKAAADMLNSVTKPLLAKLTNEAREIDPTLKSRREAQDVAEGSEAYVAHLRAVVEAERLAGHARANWVAAQSFSRSILTVEASRRVERGAYR